MVTKESVFRQIKELKINNRYDLGYNEIKMFLDLTEENLWDGLYGMFKYGYIKGQRALKAEMKRKAVKA